MPDYSPTSEPMLTKEELRAHLHLPNVHAVTRLMQQRKIPYLRLGYRTVRFRASEVERALEKLVVKEAGADR